MKVDISVYNFFYFWVQLKQCYISSCLYCVFLVTAALQQRTVCINTVLLILLFADTAEDMHVLYMHTKESAGKIASHLLGPAHRFTFLLESGLSDTYTQ